MKSALKSAEPHTFAGVGLFYEKNISSSEIRVWRNIHERILL